MKTIYCGGPILPLSGPLYPEAVLTEDAVIRAVGPLDALQAAAPAARRVFLDGAALLPAFLDAHSHFSQVASSLLQISFAGVKTTADMEARIAAFLQKSPAAENGFLIARDYDQNAGMPPLPLSVLDRLSPTQPLLVQHQSGHMGYCNSAALAALSITAETKAPAGGKIGLDHGALTGYLEENAYFTYLRRAPMPGPEALLAAYDQAQTIYASQGITTVQEGMLVTQMLPFYALLRSRDALRLDLVAYPDLPSLNAAISAMPEAVGRYDGHVKLGGLKIFLDGSPQGKTAWMRTPYLGGTDCGYGTMTDDAVLSAMETAAKRGLQLLAHCNGDAAAAQYLRCMAQCQKALPRAADLRNVMIHAQFLDLDQLPEVARLRVIPSFFVAHVLHWGDTHIRNFGMERAARISPAASALSRSIPFTFHQDAPVIAPDMLETLYCAVCRRTAQGVLLGEAQRIPVLEALKAVTIHAAYQYFEEDQKGSIAPGKRADFVILSGDPLKTAPEDLRSLQVLAAVKDGVPLFHR